MNIEMDSLYVARLVVDIILLVYMYWLYSKLKIFFKNLEYLVYCRVLLLTGYGLVFFGAHLSVFISIMFAHTLFLFANICLVYGLSSITGVPFRRLFHSLTVTVFIILYAYATYVLPSIGVRSIILSSMILLQLGVFVIDYMSNKKTANRLYLPAVALLLITIAAIFIRLISAFQKIHYVISPVYGSFTDAMVVIVLTVTSLTFSMTLSTLLHKAQYTNPIQVSVKPTGIPSTRPPLLSSLQHSRHR